MSSGLSQTALSGRGHPLLLISFWAAPTECSYAKGSAQSGTCGLLPTFPPQIVSPSLPFSLIHGWLCLADNGARQDKGWMSGNSGGKRELIKKKEGEGGRDGTKGSAESFVDLSFLGHLSDK